MAILTNSGRAARSAAKPQRVLVTTCTNYHAATPTNPPTMDKVLYQLEQRLGAVKDASMIDPVEFGELKGAVAALQIQVGDFKTRQAVMDQKLDMVLDRMAEAKGGWRTLMWLGGAAGSLGAALSWVFQRLTNAG